MSGGSKGTVGGGTEGKGKKERRKTCPSRNTISSFEQRENPERKKGESRRAQPQTETLRKKKLRGGLGGGNRKINQEVGRALLLTREGSL